jgi:phospholipid/cholesterol/gamma-HCH transport system permease protein
VATGWDVGVGFVKAPVFGMIIALVGCYEGLKVTGSAESVGQQTTRSVVEAIFMILVLDAFFAVFFTTIGI